jgi:chemotaxis protein methyltransferase CheR
MGDRSTEHTMNDVGVAPIELDLLLEAVFQRYGYDFRSYTRSFIERQTRQFLPEAGCAAVSEMIPKVLHDEAFFWRLARRYSISVTEMFRDPFVYRAVRERIVPLLRAWPHFTIWHAGCATGEEVYSLAIVLKEEGVYDQATIYATDFNDEVLERAGEGVYEADGMRVAGGNYLLAGGKASLSDHCSTFNGAVAMDGSLKERLTFANHDLAGDDGFAETHLVFCRNVLIHFNRELQNRVLGLFTEGLVHGGFLCLGTEEDIRFSDVSHRYAVVDRKARLFRKLDP